MEIDLFEQKATADRLRHLATSGHLDEQALKQAFDLAGYIPDGPAWRNFLNFVLLILGTAFTISGVFFFFAFNWADMHRFFKFGLIETGILVTAGLAFYLGLTKLSGKIALAAAALLVGALLAVSGQAYQTGADAYQLFLAWAILITGWVVISAFAPLWFGLLVLLNIAIATYWGQVWADGSAAPMFITLAILDAIALFAWEAAHHRDVAWLRHRWLPRLVTLGAFIVLIIPTLEFIFDFDRLTESDPFLWAAPVLYALFTGLILIFYTTKVQDLLTLTLAALSLIIVFTSTIGKLLPFDSNEALTFLILGLIIIGQAGLAVTALLKLSKSWEDSYV